jgi:hypothetical protein
VNLLIFLILGTVYAGPLFGIVGVKDILMCRVVHATNRRVLVRIIGFISTWLHTHT